MSRRKSRKRRLVVFPLWRLIPNLVTIGGLCCGLSSMRFAIEGEYPFAVTLLAAAAIIDGMDGRLARLLNSASLFGAQLDSLSDFLCFGIAPPFVLYMWKLHDIRDAGWAVVLFFCVCCALRLARFNTNLTQEREPWQMKFFVGVPSPAGAMLALLPLVSSFYAPGTIFSSGFFCILWVALMGMMMASKVPTFAAKHIRIHHDWLLLTMLGLGLAMVLLFIEPWVMFTLCGLIYLGFIPLSIRRYKLLAAFYGAKPANSSFIHDEVSSPE